MRAYRWPADVFSRTKTTTSHEQASASHEIAAIGYHNKSVDIAKKYGGVGPGGVTSYGKTSQADWQSIMDFNRKALAEAESADIDEMNKWYSGYGDHFRDEFTEGLTLVIKNSDAMTQSTAIAYLHGQELMNKFGDWYTANLDRIRHK